jgi:hypothetical protein
MINGLDIPAIQSKNRAFLTTASTTCCSFEMIRASFQQQWAGRGSLRYT